MKLLILSAIFFCSSITTFAQWGLTGNSITSTQFLGTTNNQPFLIKRNNSTIFDSDLANNFGIGLNVNLNYATSNNYFIGNTISGNYSENCMGLGHNIYFDGVGGDVIDAYAFGRFLEIGDLGFCIGKGFNSSNPLSVGGEGISFGYKSTLATLFVGASNGVNTTGNVGIGTTTPSVKLDVNGDAKVGNTSERHFLKIASNQWPELRFTTPTDNEGMRLGVAHADNATYGLSNGDFYNYNVNSDRMDFIVKKSGGIAMGVKGGNISIGTYSPENVQGWDKVLEVRGQNHSKIITTTSGAVIQTGLWSHNIGFFGAPGGGIVGTSTNHSFSIITNSLTRLTVNNNGGIGIGTTCVPIGFKLAVKGKVICEEIEVKLENNNCWADFVFDDSYKLMPLSEVEKFVIQNKHLPNIPSSNELVDNGVNINEMLKLHMQKIEELTLYMIQLKKENEELRKILKY